MNGQTLLNAAHIIMTVCALLSTAALYSAYVIAESLSLGGVLISHIALIIFPAIFKLGYILRLVALKHLGRPVD